MDLAATDGLGESNLSWTAPYDNGSAITDYVIHWSRDGFQSDDQTFNDGVSTNTSVTVTGLPTGAPFKIISYRVFSVNAIGTSGASNTASSVPFASRDIFWTDQVRVSVSGNVLTKTSGGNSWNAGAASFDYIENDGSIEFTVGATNAYRMFGFSTTNANAHYNTIHYAIYLRANGTLQVYEKGRRKGNFGSYSVGDILRVERQGSAILYKRNGVTIYTSGTSSSGNLIADVSIYTMNGTITNGKIYGVLDIPTIVTLEYPDFPRKKWMMWGVPVVPEDPDPFAVVGDDFGGQMPDGFNWRLSRWNTAQEGYAYYGEDGPDGIIGLDPPDFAPGFGFWLIQDVNESPTIDVTGALNLNYPDTVGVEPPPSAGVNGLNLMANPANRTIDWSNTLVTDGAQTLSILDAAVAGWVSAYAYIWDFENEEYDVITPDASSLSDTISTWGGFWFNQIEFGKDLELIFPKIILPKLIAPSRPFVNLDGIEIQNDRSAGIIPDMDWLLDFKLAAVGGKFTDIGNRIGVSKLSSNQLDGLDAHYFTPMIPRFGALFFPHDDPLDSEVYWSENPVKLDYDFRSNTWDEQIWKMRVQDVGVSGDWTLEWPNINNVPGGVKLSLFSEDTLIYENIVKYGSHSFSLSRGDHRDFIIKAVRINDQLPPFVNARLVVNPLANNDLDLYIFPNEPVNNMTVSVDDSVRETEFCNINNNIYRSNIRIDRDGIHRITFGMTDIAGNSTTDTLLLNIQGTQTDSSIFSPDRYVRLVHFSDTTNSLQFISIGTGLNESRFVLPAEMIGEIYSVFLPGHDSENLVKIIFNLLDFGLKPSQGAEVSLYQETLDGWQPIETFYNIKTTTLEGTIHTSGRFALLKIGGHSQPVYLLPEQTALLQNYPNPFNSTTLIPFTLAKESRIKITIYNLLGREVIVLKDEFIMPGFHKVIWRGRDKFGVPAASGVYFIQFEAANVRHVRKLSMIK